MKFQSPSLLILGATLLGVLGTGCSYDLSSGSYEMVSTLSTETLNGDLVESGTLVDLSVTKVRERGPDLYEINVCEGFVPFLSSLPCFDDLEVTDGPDGFSGYEEVYWSKDIQGDYCYGIERVSITGDIFEDDGAEVRLEYRLTLDGDADPGCRGSLADQVVWAEADGLMVLD